METAVREVYEEVGYQVNLKVPILPDLTISQTRLFFLVVPHKTPFITRDKREIMAINWFDVQQLHDLDTRHMTSLLKKFVTRNPTNKFNFIKNKLQSYKNNYPLNNEDCVNHELFTIVKQMQTDLSLGTQHLLPAQRHYECFYAIQSKYQAVLNHFDLIQLIQCLIQ